MGDYLDGTEALVMLPAANIVSIHHVIEKTAHAYMDVK